MARPKKYATAAEKQAAYRDRYAVLEFRIEKETADTLDKLSEALDVSRNEVIASIIKFGLLNRNWFTLGLFGKRLPYAKNPLDDDCEKSVYDHFKGQ
ncbi:MAG: ribbon-helix-helix protein, CopG family [Fluviibacter sp.]